MAFLRHCDEAFQPSPGSQASILPKIDMFGMNAVTTTQFTSQSLSVSHKLCLEGHAAKDGLTVFTALDWSVHYKTRLWLIFS